MDDWDLGFDEYMYFGDSGFDPGSLDLSGFDEYMNFDPGSLDLGGIDEYMSFDPTGDTNWDDWLGTEVMPSESDVTVDAGGNMVFKNPDGTIVTYDANGMVRTQDPSGRNAFYHSTDGRDYFVDYTDLTPGSFVETFSRQEGGEGPTRYGAYHTTDGRDYFIGNEDVYTPGSNYDVFSRASGGEGPTRYTQYSGTGDNARVVDYSDVYGPGGGRVVTTGPGGKKVIYEDGKVIDEGKVTDRFKETVKTITKTLTDKDNAALLALLGGLAGLMGNKGGGGGGGGVGYQGGIPKYTATRGAAGSPTAGGRRAGGAGLGSLTGGVTYTKAAAGGLMGLAEGGKARPARYLAGGTDGMADKIQTDIDGKQPARLSHGEFVIPADVVSHLGNGNSDAGANVLYDMMSKVRKARTGTTKQGKQINPNKFVPGKGR